MKNIYKTKIMKKYDDDEAFNPNYDKHHLNINEHYLVCGGTGSGKSNCVVNLLTQFHDTFSVIYIFTKDPSEKLYKMLAGELKDKCIVKPITEIIDYETLPKDGQKMVIFDDFICENKNLIKKIETYSTMARKKFCTCFYLVQNFFSCPTTIRRNIAYIILLKMTDKKNLNMIMKVLPHDFNENMVNSIIKNATKFKMNICIIDLKTYDESLVFRRNIDEFYNPANLELYNYDGLEN